jgi:uncharacterized damage-inducible protein DinB
MNAEGAKAAAEVLCNAWQGESAATTKVLAAVKDDNRDYKPDPKSRTAWELATHLATADMWFIDSIVNGAFVWDQDGAKQAESRFSDARSVADFYNTTLPAKLAQLKALPGDKLTEPLDFFGMMKMPRVQFIAMASNHSIHHRGQLAAYLRPMGSKVPDIYGPSADAEKAAT